MRILTMAILLASVAAYPVQAQRGDRDGVRAHGERSGGEMRGGEVRAPRNDPAPQIQHRQQIQNPEAAGQSRDHWEYRGQRLQTPDRQAGNRWEQRGQAPSAPTVRSRPESGNWGGNRTWQRHGNDTMTTGTPNATERRRWDGSRSDGRRWDGNRNDERRWDGNRNDGRRWDGNRDDDRKWDGRRDHDRAGNPGIWHRGNDGTWQRRQDWNRDNRHWNRGYDHRDWKRTWRNDRRYDWRHYRDQYRHLYRAPRYYNPYGYGYGYRRFGIGIYLDSLFYGNSYWLSDPFEYRLPPAPYGCRWVRYYDDVLLVDVRTGYVVDVIYDFFW